MGMPEQQNHLYLFTLTSRQNCRHICMSSNGEGRNYTAHTSWKGAVYALSIGFNRYDPTIWYIMIWSWSLCRHSCTYTNIYNFGNEECSPPYAPFIHHCGPVAHPQSTSAHICVFKTSRPLEIVLCRHVYTYKCSIMLRIYYESHPSV